jgi:hypothetical protein
MRRYRNRSSNANSWNVREWTIARNIRIVFRELLRFGRRNFILTGHAVLALLLFEKELGTIEETSVGSFKGGCGN